MVYPGEKKDRKEYQDYVIEVMNKGEEPLPEDEWRKKIKNADNKSNPTTALSNY